MITPLRTYIRGKDLVSMRDEVAGKSYVYHFDHQGTTQCLTDTATGAVTDTFAADAWGVQVKRTGNADNPLWFRGNPGTYRQEVSGYDFANDDWIRPSSGRWMSGLLAGVPRFGLRGNTGSVEGRRYAYRSNRPTMPEIALGACP